MEAPMQYRPRLTAWLGTSLSAISVLLLCATGGLASDQAKLTEEFHQTYQISATGRIELENINGPVHITRCDRNEVKADAIKRAWTKQRLDEARIDISSHSD